MISLLLGGITHHFIGSSLPYCGRINNNDFGTIQNSYVIGMIGDDDLKIGIISGKDSACANIVGPVVSARMAENLDFVLGAYNTNFKSFHKLGIQPPSINGQTPIVGLNYKINLYDGDNFKVNINNIVSVGIVSHALSIDF